MASINRFRGMPLQMQIFSFCSSHCNLRSSEAIVLNSGSAAGYCFFPGLRKAKSDKRRLKSKDQKIRSHKAVAVQDMETPVAPSSMVEGQEKKVLIFCTRFARAICSGVSITKESSRNRSTSKAKKNETLRRCGSKNLIRCMAA